MPYPLFDRSRLSIRPLLERENKVSAVRDFIAPDAVAPNLDPVNKATLRECVQAIRKARADGRPVIVAFGAHTIKNGLAPVLIRLMEGGWLTLLATNGAGIIHDWEFSFLGQSSEDVRANVRRGQFGIWEETGRYLNLALAVGAYEGLGYGESIGKMIVREGLDIPDPAALVARACREAESSPALAASAIDLAGLIWRGKLPAGFLPIRHAYKQHSAQAAAYRLGVPFTAHPMFGHDIIYTHPLNHGAAIGRTAERDFLTYAHQAEQLQGGVYLSVGSAVMSPMVFEKSLSMARNVAIREGSNIDTHCIFVVDLAQNSWDWSAGEPPKDHPAYYLRYCKTFSRMDGVLRYICADNRDFFLSLLDGLRAARE